MATNPPVAPRTVGDDIKLVRDRLTPVGIVMILLIYGFPAGVSTVLGVKGSLDPIDTFLKVLQFTFPLTTGVAIFLLGLYYFNINPPSSPYYGWAFLLGVGLVTAYLAVAMSGVKMSDFDVPQSGHPGMKILGFLFSVIAVLWNAYTPIVFVCGVIAGGALVWILGEIAVARSWITSESTGGIIPPRPGG